MGKLSLRAAETEAAEERSWWCRDCDRPAEDHSDYCWSCGSYWADVANGLFEDDWRSDLTALAQEEQPRDR